MRSVTSRSHQRGAVSLMAALLIVTIGVAALVSIDVGFVFYTQRQLQKLVDVAALSGAQQLKSADDLPTTSANVLASVAAAAVQNGYAKAVANDCTAAAAGAADGVRACLGLWDPANAANGDSVRHFNPGYPTTTVSANAVRVQATRTVPLLFMFQGGQSRQLHAEAIAAASPPAASFTLGSGLLRLSSGNGLLGLLLGNSVNLSVADWSGLVGANVTLEQLRLRAGVGTVDQLLNTSLSIQDFYALVLGAAGQSALLNAALGSPTTQLGLNGIGTSVTLGQMLDLGVLTPAAASAAEVGLNVASLLTTAAYVARGTSAVDLSSLNVKTALGSIGGSMYIIQPPKVAVGPAKQLPDGTWKTTATTAQLGLKLAAQVSLPVLIANVDLNLPLWLKVAQAKGDLTNIQCAAATTDRRATINVATATVDACLGSASGTGCAAGPVTIGDVQVLPLGLLTVLDAKVTGQPTTQYGPSASSSSVVLAPGGTATTSSSTVLSNTVANVFNALNPSLSLSVLQLGLPAIQPADLLAPLLIPLTALVDQLVSTLTNLLGISIANADLWLNGVDCNNAELVY
jgi:uncharacterized membrane protein